MVWGSCRILHFQNSRYGEWSCYIEFFGCVGFSDYDVGSKQRKHHSREYCIHYIWKPEFAILIMHRTKFSENRQYMTI